MRLGSAFDFRPGARRRVTIWLLALILPLQGLSATLVQAHGPAHRHVQTSPGLVLTDFRRDLGARTEVSPVEQAVVDVFHGHSHAGTKFHYHALDDTTVVYVDGQGFAGSSGHDDGAATEGGLAFFPLPVTGQATVMAGHATHCLASGSLWAPTSVISTPLERPPQALRAQA